MPDRPIGDELDQHLRRSMANLADLAGPLPPLEEIPSPEPLFSSPAPQEQRPPWPRRSFAVAAVSLVLIGLLVAVTRGGEDELILTEDPVPQTWSAYLDLVEPDEAAACLVEWSVNRDLYFRIPGAQFTVSDSVAEFQVASTNARAWLDRYESGFRLLDEIDAPIEQRLEILALMRRAEIQRLMSETRQRLDSSDGTVDLAPILNFGAQHADVLFTSKPSCPFALENQSMISNQLVQAAADDAHPNARTTSCIDAELIRLIAEHLPAIKEQTVTFVEAGLSTFDASDTAAATAHLSDQPVCEALRS